MDRRSNVSDPSTTGFSGHSRFSGALSGAPPRRLVPAALALGPSTARLAPRVSTALPPVVSGGEAEVRAGRVERDAELARVAADLGDEEPALDAGHGGGRERGGVGVFAELASGLHAGQAVAQVRFPAFEAGGDRWKPRTPPSARRGRRHLSYDSCPRAHRTAPLPPGSIRCGTGSSQASDGGTPAGVPPSRASGGGGCGLGPYAPRPGPATPARHHSLK
jgi:hypothetical protein